MNIIEIAPNKTDTPEDIKAMVKDAQELAKMTKADDDFLIIPDNDNL